MNKEASGALLIEHYENIQQLSAKQLDALKQGKADEIGELIAQKQLIIEHIQKNEQDFEVASYSSDIQQKLRKILTEIATLEEESRNLLDGTKEAIRGQLMASRQETKIRKAYEGTHSTGYVVNRTK